MSRTDKSARTELRKTSLPDLPDIMAAGFGLTEALAFWSDMMNAPDRTPELWWNLLKETRKKGLH